MEARNRHPKPRSVETASSTRLDAMRARRAGEVLGVLRAAAPESDGKGHPIGLWKTGWLTQPEGAA